MTVWTGAYIVSLATTIAAAFSLGDAVDRRGAGVFVVIFCLSYWSFRFGPLPAVSIHAVGYTLCAFGFWLWSQRWYGDGIAIIFACVGLLGFLSLMGVYPIETGKGFAWTFWNFHAILAHMACWAFIIGIWSRSRVLF